MIQLTEYDEKSNVIENPPKLFPQSRQEEQLYWPLQKSSEIKSKLFKILPENFPSESAFKRFRICGKKSRYCSDCGEMSPRYMVTTFCHAHKWCPTCIRNHAIKKSNIISKAVSSAIVDYRNKGVPVLPCLVTLSLHRDPRYDLSQLIKLIKDAFGILRRDGTKSEVIKAKRNNSYQSWWSDRVIGSIYSIETPFNKITKGENQGKYAFGVHLHSIVLRNFDSKIELGVDNATGKAIGKGLRSNWTQSLQKVWPLYMGNFKFPHEEITAQADIKVAYKKIMKDGKTHKIPLITFFKTLPDKDEIEENITKYIKEACKYIVKSADLVNLIEQQRVEEYIMKTSRIQLCGVGGIFRTKGYMGKAKELVKQRDEEQERKKIELLMLSTNNWVSRCPMCSSTNLSYGMVSLSDAALSEYRLMKKIESKMQHYQYSL